MCVCVREREREKEIFKKSRNDSVLEGAGGVCVHVCACVLNHFSHVRLFATVWIIACRASLSMGFSRQEYLSGLPCSSARNLPKPGIKLLCLSFLHWFSSVQFNSVAQSCQTLCDPMDCSMPGLPVHHQLPELAQTHVHQVSDAIQPSHSLSSPSLPAFNLSQHQDLFQ